MCCSQSRSEFKWLERLEWIVVMRDDNRESDTSMNQMAMCASGAEEYLTCACCEW